jgi:septal ring-binding cell division protein DamX
MRLIYPVVALVGIFTLSGCSYFSTNKSSRSNTASKNYGLTFEQVREAAQDGDADAQYALGYMYYYGQNVTRSGKQARLWIGRAAAQNHQQASKALKMMEAEPTYAQRESGAERIAQTGSARQWGSGQNSWQEVRGRSETKNQPKEFTKPLAYSDSKPQAKTSAPSTIDAEKESKYLKKKHVQAKSDKNIKNHHKAKHLSQGMSEGLVTAQESQVSPRSAKSGSGHAQSHKSKGNAKHVNGETSKGNAKHVKGETSKGNAKQAKGNTSKGNAKHVQNDASKGNAQHAESDTLGGNTQLAQADTSEGDNQLAQADTSEGNAQLAQDNISEGNAQVVQPSANKKAKSVKGLKTPEAHQGKSPMASVKGKQTESKKRNSALSSDERKILSKPNDHYTIQITGSSSKNTVQQFIAANHLQKKAKIYHTKVKGKDFYGLIYGNYSSQAAATAGIAKLPENIKQLKPWAKSYAAIKDSINSANTH